MCVLRADGQRVMLDPIVLWAGSDDSKWVCIRKFLQV